MSTAPAADPRRLLLLADDLASVHAEVGEARTHAWLAAAVDAASHAVVDLADGRLSPSTATSVPPESGAHGHIGRPSCSAAAASLRRVRSEVLRLTPCPPHPSSTLRTDLLQCLADLADALQRLAVATPGSGTRSVLPGVHRTLRRCHRCLQPPDTLSS